MSDKRISWGARLGWTLGLVLLVLAGAVGALSWYLPRTTVKADLERTLSRDLGRPVRIDGGVGLSYWPLAGVEARGVHIANLPGGRGPDLMSAEALDIGISPLPLLSGRVEIRRILVRAPMIHLEKLADGRVNWTLGAGPHTGEAPEWLSNIRLDEARVERGLVSYLDAATGASQTVSQLDLDLTLKSLDQPLSAAGAFWWRGRQVQVRLGAAQPRALVEGRSAPLSFSLDSTALTSSFEGTLSPRDGVLDGALTAAGPSLRDLSAWGGKAMPPGGGLGRFSVKGRMLRRGQAVDLSGAEVGVDHLRARGDLRLDLSRARPFVAGALSFRNLDLNPYLGPEDKTAGWSTRPINLTGLAAFDADLAVEAGGVSWRRMRFGPTRARFGLAAGRADIGLERISLYGGGGSGRIRAFQDGASVRLGVDLVLDGVQAQPFLRDLAGVDRVEGPARLTLRLTGAGADQARIMRSLAGSASIAVRDGDLRGVDLSAVSRQVTSALTGQAVGPSARTRFSLLSGDFGVSGGAAGTRNLRLVNPDVTLNGMGRIDIGGQALDLVIKPQGSARLGGRSIGLGVPFRVHGPWAQLRYEADLKSLAESAIQDGVDKLLGGTDALGGLFGQAPKPAAPTKPAGKPKKPSTGDLLHGLGVR